VWSSSIRTVTRALPGPVNLGRYAATGRSSVRRPCSTSRMIALVVATTFVSEARSQSVESGDGTGEARDQV